MDRDRAVLVGAPLSVALLGVVHPLVDPAAGPVASLRGQTSLWLAVHLVLPIAVILLALALGGLVADLPGRPAAIARATLLPFAVFYSMFDGVVGIGTGVLVQLAQGLPAGAAELVGAYWAARMAPPIGLLPGVGGLAWAGAPIATATALRPEPDRPWPATPAPPASGPLFAIDHVPPWGPAAMVALLAGVAPALLPQLRRSARAAA